MDTAAWIEVGKIVAGVGTAVVALGTPIGFVWRFVRSKAVEAEELRRKLDGQEVQLHKSLVDLEHQQDLVQDEKARYAQLNAQQAQTRERWKKNIKEDRDKRASQHKSELAARDQLLSQERALVAHLRENEQTLSQQLEDLKNQAIETAQGFQNVVTERDVIRHNLEAAEKQIQNLLAWDGRLWNRPLPENATKFRPLKNRNMPIVSVLNFKGGVGKTSMTVNLAGLLGRSGKRTLMIDLDYQRSLSQLVLPNHVRKTLQLEGHCLQHFLSGDRHDTDHLMEFAHQIESGIASCAIITNSHAIEIRRREDSLEETENQLMAEWIIKRESMRDIRLFLREGLHGTGIESHFDYVLLDCPPRITASTINALAASDFVLVPVVLDEVSANSVTPLIASLRGFRELFPNLHLLGVVANQAKMHNGSPKQQEQEIWENLQLECNGIFTDFPVHFFDTVVPLSSAFGATIGDGQTYLAIDNEAISAVFESLTEEIQKEIRSYGHSHPSVVLV